MIPATTRAGVADAVAAAGRPPRRSELPFAIPLLGLTVIAVSLALLFGGIIWPQAANSLARTLIVTLAIIYIVARAYGNADRFSPAGMKPTPFDGDIEVAAPLVSPQSLQALTIELAMLNQNRMAPGARIPITAEQILRREVARRLQEHHGLGLADPRDRAAILALLDEKTWLLVGDPTPGVHRTPIFLSELERILEDVEKL